MSWDKNFQMLHGSSMKPFMKLKVSLVQTHEGDSTGHWKPLAIVMQAKWNRSISKNYLIVKNLGALEKKKSFLHDISCPTWVVYMLWHICLCLGIACRFWEPRKRKGIISAAYFAGDDASWWATRLRLVGVKNGHLWAASGCQFFSALSFKAMC